MALNLKLLFGDKLNTTANRVVYAPAANRCAVVNRIVLVNEGGSDITINVGVRNKDNNFAYLYGGAGQYIPAAARIEFTDEITLAYGTTNGDRLEMWAGANLSVSCLVFGAERDT